MFSVFIRAAKRFNPRELIVPKALLALACMRLHAFRFHLHIHSCWLIGRWFGWLVGCLAGWLVGWLVVGCLVLGVSKARGSDFGGPRRLPDGFKMTQNIPKTPQNGSKTAQDGLKTAQDSPKTAQDGPKTGHDGPRTAPRRPRMAPRRPRTAPRRPKAAPGQPQDSPGAIWAQGRFVSNKHQRCDLGAS